LVALPQEQVSISYRAIRDHEEQTANGEAACCLTNLRKVLPMNTPVPLARRTRLKDYILPALVALTGAGAAYAGADTTFDPALTKFTDFLEGSGGKIITVLSLAGGLIGLASGRFSLGQVAVPVGVGIGVGTGVPIVTSVVTAVI